MTVELASSPSIRDSFSLFYDIVSYPLNSSNLLKFSLLLSIIKVVRSRYRIDIGKKRYCSLEYPSTSSSPADVVIAPFTIGISPMLSVSTNPSAPYAVPVRLQGTIIVILVPTTPRNPEQARAQQSNEKATKKYCTNEGSSEFGINSMTRCNTTDCRAIQQNMSLLLEGYLLMNQNQRMEQRGVSPQGIMVRAPETVYGMPNRLRMRSVRLSKNGPLQHSPTKTVMTKNQNSPLNSLISLILNFQDFFY